MAGTKNTKNAKKKARKNSNYKTVVKYVDVDKLMRKSLCDYRNMPKPDPCLLYTSVRNAVWLSRVFWLCSRMF